MCPSARRIVAVESLEERRLFAQVPFTGTPWAVGPGLTTTIQAEDYDRGGAGVAYHDATPTTNTGGAYRTGPDDGVDVKPISKTANQYRIGDAYAGEWVEYTLDVKQSGTYRLDLRLGQQEPNAKVHVEVGGTNLTGPVSVPDTNSYSTFSTVTRDVPLTAGTRVLRLAFDVNAVNGAVAGVDWLRLTAISTQPPSPPPPPSGTTTTIATTAYVRGGASAGKNFGGATDLIVKQASADNTREAYLKLSLPGGSITSAKLRLYGRLNESGSVKVNVHSASNTSWSEGGLTWNNKPAAGSTVRGSFTVSGTAGKWYEVDLTAFLKAENAVGRSTVTLVLKAAAKTTPFATFASDDAAANKPQLVVNGSSAPTPSTDLATLRRQFLDMRYGMFIHFGFDTWTNGDGDAPADVNKFNPTRLDTDQWAEVAKASGMKYGVLTTKHGSGFALWDSSQTGYDVAGSNWGKARKAAGQSADVVRMYVDSFREQGLGVGLYYSIYDRKAGITAKSDPTWATNYVKAELTHLLTNYGHIQVLWTDAWEWMVGYSAVRWREVYDHIKSVSPNTLLMENNHEHSYAHSDIVGYEIPTKPGVPSGNTLAAEVCDTIRDGNYWFYRTWDPAMRSVDRLVSARITANSRNANYLLNVGPDTDGLIPAEEVEHLQAVQAEWLRRT